MKTYGFNKAQRICSENDFKILFERGNSFFEFPLKFIWTFVDSTNMPVKVAISVPKKRFKRAVDRNLLKRRVKEAYRLQAPIVFKDSNHKDVLLLLVYSDSQIKSYSEIYTSIGKGLEKLKQYFEAV